MREVLAKADKNFVDEVLTEAAVQEALGNHTDAKSLLDEAILIENFHITRMLAAA
jgi:hypothetical protein